MNTFGEKVTARAVGGITDLAGPAEQLVERRHEELGGIGTAQGRHGGTGEHKGSERRSTAEPP